MLETKGLYKIYKPKKGVPVTALKNVNIRFPDRGMVFLLGKSGSGKSTLLNVLGGLDRYDKGEILIKGVSSKAFRQKHFDSYRNTYVGFIFQEYNVLEDFTVGANIALALQLQGKKATDAAINEILNEVDLNGFGARRPNELSGGQKQRVAIARALVKQPEIIMADEPTGALDSATGRQVLETLKKLSRKRLVIVVSHDRDFAERYADRIIELADGSVIRDVERTAEVLETAEPLTFEENGVAVQAGYQLTEEDRLAINQYLAEMESGQFTLRSKRGRDSAFVPTDQAKIPHRDGAHFKLIKSKLPMRNAFKIGGSSLKHKKFRLVITILLSCIAFGLFGLADTFGAYDHPATCTESIVDTGITYTSIRKSKWMEKGKYWRDYGYTLEEQDLSDFEQATGMHLKGIYETARVWIFDSQLNPKVKLNETDIPLYYTSFSGISAVTEQDLAAMDYDLLAGRLPSGAAKEIAISEYMAEVLIKGQCAPSGTTDYVMYSAPGSVVGVTLQLDGTDYTVVGVVDTHFDMERYAVLGMEEEYSTTAEQLIHYALSQEFSYAADYSLARVAMVSPETLESIRDAEPKLKELNNGGLFFYNERYNIDAYRVGKLSDFSDRVIWIDGVKRDTLAKDELVISSTQLTGISEGELPAVSAEELIRMAEEQGTFDGHIYTYDEETNESIANVKVVGIVAAKEEEKFDPFVIIDDDLYAKMMEGAEGPYHYAVGGMPAEKSEIRQLVEYCYREDTDIRFPLQNAVSYELDMVHSTLKELAKVFLYIGLGFALFAALMLSNFIATSISYKKQEIGILRAIGSRSSDVFRIFFSESFIIAMINFVLSSVGVLVATWLINGILRNEVGILITVLNFSLRQVALLFGVSILVAAVASFFPVKRIASKKPIDAIRNR